jgi:hypothetical protein
MELPTERLPHPGASPEFNLARSVNPRSASMFRRLICAAVLLAVGVATAFSADKPIVKKKGEIQVSGRVKKLDAATGALTLTVPAGKKKTADYDFTLGSNVKVVVFGPDGRKELTAKDGLKEIKEGAWVAVIRDAGGQVVRVRIGTPPTRARAAALKGQGRPVAGLVRKVAADTLRLSVPRIIREDKDFPVTDDLRVVVYVGDEKKEFTGKEGLKEIKEGSQVSVRVDAAGKVIAVVVGTPPRRTPLKPGLKGIPKTEPKKTRLN